VLNNHYSLGGLVVYGHNLGLGSFFLVNVRNKLHTFSGFNNDSCGGLSTQFRNLLFDVSKSGNN